MATPQRVHAGQRPSLAGPGAISGTPASSIYIPGKLSLRPEVQLRLAQSHKSTALLGGAGGCCRAAVAGSGHCM